MQLRATTAVLALLVVVAIVLTVDSRVVEAQAGTIVDSATLSVATDVVNGSVVVTQSIDTGSAVFSLAMVEVADALTGDLSGQIFVEVPGGKTNSGADVIVSHQPHFRIGDQVQLALVRATPEEEQLLRGGEPVYSVVGGINGAAATSGTVVSQAEINGVNFTLLGGKWANFPVTYRINPTNDFLTNAQVTSTIQSAFQQWEDDPFSDIDFTYSGTTGASPDNYVDNLNTLGWVAPVSAADGWLAQAVWVSNGGVVSNFDIQFNVSYVFSEGALPGRFDLETVALHEIGHILGLGHIAVAGAEGEVMFPSVTSNTVKTLGPGDREGVADLYPAANPPVVYPPVGPFLDVPPISFYRDAVLWMQQQGITTGTTPTTYSPDRFVTRGEVATLLHRRDGSVTPAGQAPFTDVVASDYFAESVAWLSESGATGGTSPTTFSPDRRATRGDVAVLMWNLAGSPVVGVASPFVDIEPADARSDAITWMWSAGISVGTSSSTYSPNAPVTRAQVATFIYRSQGSPPPA